MTETTRRTQVWPAFVVALALSACGGGSAPAAVRALSSQGFTKVFNLRGGLAAWRAENLPLARD